VVDTFMRLLRPGETAQDDITGAVYAIGNFDGLHRGHQALFGRARKIAGENNVYCGVLTFSPHPAKVLSPALAPQLLLSEKEKEDGIAALGVDILAIEAFTKEFASQSPHQFIENVLRKRLRAGAVVVGEGFRFGHHAKGTEDDLRKELPVEVVPPIKEGDLVCSSTKIRELVLEGRVDAASLLLGYPYFVEGPVVEGDKRGRTIGIPTANISVERELLPKLGVYASRSHVDGKTFNSVTNIGLRPTFQGQGVRIETHLMGFVGDLYGKTLRVDLVKRIRDEQRFADINELKAQIQSDIARANEILA
jgi:riboflavin kinase / FMN adenylyltransferase